MKEREMKAIRHFLLLMVVIGASALAVAAQHGDQPKNPPPKGTPPVVNPQPKRPEPQPQQPKRPQFAFVDAIYVDMRSDERYS
ncbi:MAG: hypothetical protein JSR44_15795 [Spirochaetes bacterium]|nr:hypothetical protein [Spirochaetota bacterium]